MADHAHHQQQPTAADDERMRDALRVIVSRLELEASDRVAKRQLVENRWVEDLRQLAGEYDAKTVKELTNAKKSKLFINQTRTKTNTAEARLSDMLFPTNDSNWGIDPTPVPELSDAAKEAADKAKALVGEANEAMPTDPAQGAALAGQAQGFADTAAQAKAEMDEAKKRAGAMQAEIKDQLEGCGYTIQSRDAIRDACRLGTGIMKGPVAATERIRRSWKKVQQEDGSTGYQLEMIENPRPALYRVDPWGFFPDSDAHTVEESESFFERHLHSRKGLRALAKQPGFDKEAVRRVLREGPTKALPQYIAQVRNIVGEQNAPQDGRFQVWEYRGPLTAEDMRTVCACMGDERAEALAKTYAGDDIDPLTEICVVVYFCQGEVLKFGIHYLDSGEAIYSVYNLEKDDASIWGYGIPYIMRNSQAAMNGAWRMMMDNGGLSSRPQILINQAFIEPADGDWTLTAGKVWLLKANIPAGATGFDTFDIETHQTEFANIIALSKEFIDDETAMSILAQGEQGAHTTKTAQGMALLMNAINVVFRRMVKNFDDDMTTPNIRRMYDWNMQFSEKEHIKGDLEVKARGSSVLLVREIQSQNLMVLLQFTAHPVLGLMLKGLPLLRKTVEAMMIEADEIVATDDELKRKVEDMANQPPASDPRAEAQVAIAHENNQTKLQIAAMERDTQMMLFAEKRNMTLDQVRAQLGMKQMEVDSKERTFAAETAAEARIAAMPGQSKGSGGYLSVNEPEARPN